ncbi:MAG TPA: 16S rRNA (cytidine(1402)-2'-O)-methyltransferase [Coxiellaceae bacterium]|nr:16S rRNA (cytidine(1402)-2'-O)-methyltransferase [Coxiellaceae bacterium]
MSALYIVSTPIGNLSDMTLRAIEILKAVDHIAAEDTRHSQKLLTHYDIHTPVFSLHDHNEEARIHTILSLLNDKKSVALISDAGTPLISDPGFRLVRAVHDAHYKVIPIPGACAAIAALSASGLPTDAFIFEGFLPTKKTALIKQLEKLKSETRTIIFYESVHRIQKTLQAMQIVFGDNRMAVIARELTKSFETITKDTLKNLCMQMDNHPAQQKGEFVVMIAGDQSLPEQGQNAQVKAVLTILLREFPLKQAVKIACEITGCPHNAAYALALSLKN